LLKIRGIDIYGINGIKDLKILFNNGINIVCGKNGVGKTTILECIVSGLKNKKTSKLAKNLKYEDSRYILYGESDYDEFYTETYLDEENKRWYKSKISNEFLYFNISRSQTSAFHGSKLNTIQKWFGEIYDKQQLSIFEYDDLHTAIECFSRLDSRISFSRVAISPAYTDNKRMNPYYTKNNFKAEILVNTEDGELPLSSLSAGYLSCLSIFLEIIKKAKSIKLNKPIYEYDGLILIDEIDLHLHPEWQKKILEILRWMVPNAQIIATTHSPHIVQVAKAEEVITIKNTLGICFSKQGHSNSEYGYQGWSIEEILEDVMGLKSTHSDLYNALLKSIESDLDNLNITQASKNLDTLLLLLHPNNPIGKILSLQVASLESKL
jgi:predicted ATP-binding protein involved in virulence